MFKGIWNWFIKPFKTLAELTGATPITSQVVADTINENFSDIYLRENQRYIIHFRVGNLPLLKLGDSTTASQWLRNKIGDTVRLENDKTVVIEDIRVINDTDFNLHIKVINNPLPLILLRGAVSLMVGVGIWIACIGVTKVASTPSGALLIIGIVIVGGYYLLRRHK